MARFRKDRLKEARADAGLSAVQLAGKLAVARQNVSVWESGKASPHPASVRRMAKIFNRPITFFYEVEGPLSLKDLRILAGLTQEAVAERLGITRSAFSGYEIGIDPLPHRHVSTLAELYGVTARDIEQAHKDAQ